MCSGLERSKSSSSSTQSTTENRNNPTDMNQLTVHTEDSFSSLLEFAANNDVEGFKRLVDCDTSVDTSVIDEAGYWYVRKKGSKQVVCEHRTPLMVASTYGSIDVLKLLISLPEVDVNRTCGLDKSTALHCATSGGSVNAVDVVKLLLSVGADPNIEDASGFHPVDSIVVPPNLPGLKIALEELLTNNGSVGVCNLRVSVSKSPSPTLSSSPENGSPCSLMASPFPLSERKEYPIDPSLPDIKNSIYSTDEFRMFSFKVRPCSRAYSHDWTECPFVHPGENARRRDPRKYHYSCVPCPDFRKGACRRGDMCEYAHGVFECWLHPAQYRTRLCKDGMGCARRVCFFAHKPDELRPLYVSTGSAVPSPRSASVMDMAAALSLLPGSPSSPAFNQAMSPSSNGMAWPQPNVPTLNLPGSNLQSSRLRSSLNARDLNLDAQQQLLLTHNLSKTLTPSNLEELFSAEIHHHSSSPRYSDQATNFSPSHKSTAVLNPFQQQQTMLSPINTNVFSPKNVDHPLFSSPLRMSPRSIEPISPMGSRGLSAFAQQQQLRSLSSRDLRPKNAGPVVGSPGNSNSWTKWGSPNGEADWSVNGDELGRLRRSSSELNHSGPEPDLSWVQTLVKESPPEMTRDKSVAVHVSGTASSGEGSKFGSQVESTDHSVLGAWLEQMQLDQLVA